ncbi:MAG: methylenetetrahydrofolate reductase [Phycicoccus sp.]|nr:methylenetetrahydrofolate reductase [Phycicoccus sp.]
MNATNEPGRPTAAPTTAQAGERGDAAAMLRHLVSNIGYEVMPFKAAEESVARFVPTDVPLTVTTTAAKGVAATVDLAERLTARGYEVAPHLAARQITGRTELTEIMQRLTAAGITKAFVIGGDPPEPAGAYVDALGVLRDLNAAGSTLNTVGIGGYPEGHGTIPGPAMAQAIRDKAPLASHIVTQICFDAGTIGAWGEGLMRDNVTLPIYVGMPGPVNRQKLIRISAGIGLGQSARFLQKQQGLWRFFLPGAYNPTRLVRRLATEAARSQGNLFGLHIFTFNEIEGTEKWRLRLRSQVGLD